MRPLGLGDTTYDFRRAPDSLLVAGRHAILRTSGPAAAGKGAAAWADEPFTAPGAFSVIGGVISSLRDVVAWDRWLASAFDDPDRAEVHDEVLPARLRRIMQTGHTPIPPVLRSGSSRGCVRVASPSPRRSTRVVHRVSATSSVAGASATLKSRVWMRGGSREAKERTE